MLPNIFFDLLFFSLIYMNSLLHIQLPIFYRNSITDIDFSFISTNIISGDL